MQTRIDRFIVTGSMMVPPLLIVAFWTTIFGAMIYAALTNLPSTWQ